MKNMSNLREIVKATKIAVQTAGLLQLLPYVVPMTMRWMPDIAKDLDKKTESSAAEILGAVAGGAIGYMGIIAQAAAYASFSVDGNPECLLVPLASNLVSGCYEKVVARNKTPMKSNADTE